MMQNKLIAITGGIGSGKTEVSNILRAMGKKVVSCDEITKSLYKLPKIKKEIKDNFPSAVSGRLHLKVDKKVLSSIVFSNAEKMKILSRILTLPTMDKALKTARRLGGEVFMEVPLLFEYGYQNIFDKIIVVKRDLEQRKKGVFIRSNLDEQSFLDRVKSQTDYDALDTSSYIVIENNGTLADLKEKVVSILNNL